MLVRCLLLLQTVVLSYAASVFEAASDVSKAAELADSVDLKTLSSADFNYLIKEQPAQWLSTAHRVLSRAQETPLDFAAPVRSAVTSVRKQLDDLIRALDKKYGEASQVSPAFQWAQNSTHAFLQIKFAQRWNAPGALELENSSISVSDCCFSFKGFGEHSMIKKEYKLFLQFLDPVSKEGSHWHFAAAGRLTVTVAKVKARKWERLLRSENVAPGNMGVWRDMQEKWKNELNSHQDGKLKKIKSDEDDDDDDDEPEECDSGTFKNSKVVEFCPKAFMAGSKAAKKTWTVLFYTPDQTSSEAKMAQTLFRHLADVVPAHNKNAAVAAVDCTRHKALCEEKSAGAKKLPLILRFLPGKTEGGEPYLGELALEDMAAWAAKSDEEKDGKKKKKKTKKEL